MVVKVIRSTILDAPADAVWETLRDFNGHDRWHPAVTVSYTHLTLPTKA